MPSPIPRLALTRDQAAEAVGLSSTTLQRAIDSGALRVKRTSQDSGRYLIRVEDLNVWFDGLVDWSPNPRPVPGEPLPWVPPELPRQAVLITAPTVPRVAVTRKEAATACGVSEDTIQRATNGGTLPAKRTSPDGGRCLINITDLHAWVDRLPDG